MHKFINACLVMALLVSAFVVYSLEHSTRGIEREIANYRKDIENEKELIKVLNAEWSSLTRPERLQKLARDNLKLQTVKPSQYVSETGLSARVPAEPVVVLVEEGKDAISKILDEME